MNNRCMGVLDEKCGKTTNGYFVCSEDLEIGTTINSCVHKKHASKGMKHLFILNEITASENSNRSTLIKKVSPFLHITSIRQ